MTVVRGDDGRARAALLRRLPGRDRPQADGGRARAARAVRPAHRPPEPRALQRPPEPGDRAPRRARRRPPSTSSTWTASSGSTTASATPPATRCCARSPRASSATLRPEDTVARFGGDEFTILCESVGGVLEAVGVADRLQREIAQPLRAGGAELRLSASIGIALAEPGDDADGSRLVEDADAAMYRAKERGGARTELFDMAMRERAVDAISIEQELSARARARRAAALLPAAREPRHGRDGRRRGADPLGAPRARPAQPGQVPPGRRGERPDRAGGRLGGRRGVPPAARLGPPQRRAVELQPRREPERARAHASGRGADGAERGAALGARPASPHHRGHREHRDGGPRLRLPRAARAAATPACGSRSTTSAPATPRSTTCARCRRTS